MSEDLKENPNIQTCVKHLREKVLILDKEMAEIHLGGPYIFMYETLHLEVIT